MNKYLACWGDSDFLMIIIPFILIVIIALFFEYKYLDERQEKRKYYDLFMYINKPTTLPLTTIKASQKPTMGKSISELAAYSTAKLSKAMPIITASVDEIILLNKSIKRSISRIKRWCNQKQIKPCAEGIDNYANRTIMTCLKN